MPSSSAAPHAPVGLRLLRAWIAVASRVYPRLAEWHAARLFTTPRRGPARPPVVPGPHPFQRLDAELDGARLSGWSLGLGPAVLLVHGWSGSSLDLATMAQALAAGGYRAVAFDFPAHGASPGRRTSLGEWHRALPTLAASVGGVQAIVGHSLGAAAVTLAVEAGLATRGVVLVAPPLGPRFYLARLRAWIGLGERHAAGMERFLLREAGGTIDSYDAGRAAANLTVPALVIHDPADTEVPFAHGEAVARAWRGAVLVPVPNAGHTRILMLPEVTARVVAFVKELESGACATRTSHTR